MAVETLAQNCADEITEFKRHLQDLSPSCLKLFYLAFWDEMNEAFAEVYRLYETQVRRWVELHPWFGQSEESIDYFVSAAWAKFYYATRGSRFAQFETIAQIMMYLKRCVHSTIAQHMRKLPPFNLELDDLEEVLEMPMTSSPTLAVEAIWERICELLPDPKDQRLAEYSFYKDAKPAEIVKLDPDSWQTTNRVYKDLWRIRQTLRTDPTMRSLLGLETDQAR